jgi:hypothetical protein
MLTLLMAACGDQSAPAPASAPAGGAAASGRQAPRTMKMTTPIPASITTPDLVASPIGTLRFFDGVPDDATTQLVYDNIDRQRGVEAFLAAMPGASVYAIREGLKSQGADNQTILVFESLIDSRSLFLTGNSETVYHLMWLDVRNGPLVIESPPNVLGIIDDHWFKYVGDVGNAGPDKGKGGKFLLVGPGHTGNIPTGCHVFRTPTYGNVYFWRGFVENGSTETAVNNGRKFAKVYPLSAAANPPPMKFVNVSGKEFNTIHANDFRYYEEVNHIVQEEPSEALNPETLGLLAAIGIEKRHGHHAGDGRQERWRGIAICDRHGRREGTGARRQQDLQGALAAERAGEEFLVLRALRQPDPLDAADRRTVPEHRQPVEGCRRQC